MLFITIKKNIGTKHILKIHVKSISSMKKLYNLTFIQTSYWSKSFSKLYNFLYYLWIKYIYDTGLLLIRIINMNINQAKKRSLNCILVTNPINLKVCKQVGRFTFIRNIIH